MRNRRMSAPKKADRKEEASAKKPNVYRMYRESDAMIAEGEDAARLNSAISGLRVEAKQRIDAVTAAVTDALKGKGYNIVPTNRIQSSIQSSPEKGAPTKVDSTGMSVTFASGDCHIKLNGKDANITVTDFSGIPQKVRRLLVYLTMILAKNNSIVQRKVDPKAVEYRVEVSVDEYADKCGIKNKYEAAKSMKEAGEFLFAMSFSWTGVGVKKGSYLTPFQEVRLITARAYTGVGRGRMIFDFHPEVARIYCAEHYAYIPDEYFRMRDPVQTSVLFYLATQKATNAKRGGRDIYGIASILDNCPDIKKAEDVAKVSRHPERDIVARLEKALDSCKSFNWEYCNRNGAPLTDEQMSGKTNISEYRSRRIKVYWKDYPQISTELIRPRRSLIGSKKRAPKAE